MPTFPEDRSPAARPESREVVRLEQVGVRYGRGAGAVHAVRGVDLTLRRGETLGLVGESGSGKSTLGRALTGLVRPTEGRATLDGTDLTVSSPGRRRTLLREVGIVFQDPSSSLNPRHTVGRSVAEPLRLASVSGAAARARVADVLASVDLDPDFAGRFPHQLSGGQRQRVAIARALVLRPQLVVADEPTSALDVSVQARVLALLGRLQDELGFACLFITHDLAVVGAVADRVAVMHEGVIVEHGETAQVLHRPEHPYTAGLLAAAPVADPQQQRARREERTARTRRLTRGRGGSAAQVGHPRLDGVRLAGQRRGQVRSSRRR